MFDWSFRTKCIVYVSAATIIGMALFGLFFGDNSLMADLELSPEVLHSNFVLPTGLELHGK